MEPEDLSSIKDWLLLDPKSRGTLLKHLSPNLVAPVVPNKIHKENLGSGFLRKDWGPGKNRTFSRDSSWLSQLRKYVEKTLKERELLLQNPVKVYREMVENSPAWDFIGTEVENKAAKGFFSALEDLAKGVFKTQSVNPFTPVSLGDLYPSRETGGRMRALGSSPGDIFSALLGLQTTPHERITQKYPLGI